MRSERVGPASRTTAWTEAFWTALALLSGLIGVLVRAHWRALVEHGSLAHRVRYSPPPQIPSGWMFEAGGPDLLGPGTAPLGTTLSVDGPAWVKRGTDGGRDPTVVPLDDYHAPARSDGPPEDAA